MSRYIDTDELIRYGKCGILVYWEDIENAPSIDIVRCKECTERDDDWCMYWGNVINLNDFCSYGEREGE